MFFLCCCNCSLLYCYAFLVYFVHAEVLEVNSGKYDIVVYGASGFTGQFVVEELARTITEEHLTWAVAGRDKQKLQAVLATASKETGESLLIV